MKVGGYNKQIDYERLGPTLVLAASVILAIRTAKKEAMGDPLLANRDWETEIENSLRLASTIVSHATSKYPNKFWQKDVPWYEATDEEVPK